MDLDYSCRTEYKYTPIPSFNKILLEYRKHSSVSNKIFTDKNQDLDKFLLDLKKFIEYQIGKNCNILDLSFISFPFIPIQNDLNESRDYYEDLYSYILEYLGEKSNRVKKINFYKCDFYSRVKINDVIKHELDFTYATFHTHVVFDDVIFKKEVDFSQTIFIENVHFLATTFKKNTYFDFIEVDKKIHFGFSVFLKTFNMNYAFLNKISLEGVEFNQANFIGLNIKNGLFLKLRRLKWSKKPIVLTLSNWQYQSELCKTSNKQEITKDNFSNKESARLIKLHFETEKNITEANKFFKIEQELYIEELKDPKSTHTNKRATLFVLHLNKYVSDFGTDWIRPLIVMIIFSFFVSFFYNCFDIPESTKKYIFHNILQSDRLIYSLGGLFISLGLYLVYNFKHTILGVCCILIFLILGWILYSSNSTQMINSIALIMNPLNMFKSKDYFEHIAPLGIFAKFGISILLYQFIMAFRNNTRRK